MKRTKALIEKTVNSLLQPHGFSKKGAVWTLEKDDGLLAVWLQGSRYSKGAYVNFMVWYPKIADREFKSFPAGDFHLNFRGDIEKRDEIWSSLQFDEQEVDPLQYEKHLSDLFFAASLERLLSLGALSTAISHCKQDDRSMSYSQELMAAANVSV
jgi:hypothetical protein